MSLPPLEPFDIECLAPTYHDLTLTLPSISKEDVSLAFRGFSARLSEVCGKTALDAPRLFTDVIGRSMLVIASKVFDEPETVFEPLRIPAYSPWTQRRVKLLAPSADYALHNHTAVLAKLRELGADDDDIEHMFYLATIAVVGSLATIGRLPMQEVPATDSYN